MINTIPHLVKMSQFPFQEKVLAIDTAPLSGEKVNRPGLGTMEELRACAEKLVRVCWKSLLVGLGVGRRSSVGEVRITVRITEWPRRSGSGTLCHRLRKVQGFWVPRIDFSTFVSGTFWAKKVPKPFSSKASSNFQQALTNRNPKLEFLLEKKLAITCQARVSESGFGQGFPKVPEER